MNHSLRSVIAFFIVTGCIATANGQQSKKAIKKVETHRATLVLNMQPVVDRKAHLPYAALPKWGSLNAVIPEGAEIVSNGVDSFYYRSGIFYTKKPKGYVITNAVPGVRIHGLPFGYRIAMAKGKPYFYYFGTFYEQVNNSDYYETVIAPEEAIVDAIPDGYEIRKREKEEYYFLGGAYYAQVPAPALKDKIGYEVVTIIEAY